MQLLTPASLHQLSHADRIQNRQAGFPGCIFNLAVLPIEGVGCSSSLIDQFSDFAFVV